MKIIYLDNAAATPVNLEVQKEMIRGMKIYGNPSSYNDLGREAAKELYKARIKVARFLGAHPEEIVFTGSGSEANNMAIMILSSMGFKNRNEIVTTHIEHPSVLEPIKRLNFKGFKTVFVRIDQCGFIDVEV